MNGTIVVGYDNSSAAKAALLWAGRQARVAEALIVVARKYDASLIVIGMTSRGTLSELISGSTQHELLHHAVRPVVAVPATWTDAAVT